MTGVGTAEAAGVDAGAGATAILAVEGAGAGVAAGAATGLVLGLLAAEAGLAATGSLPSSHSNCTQPVLLSMAASSCSSVALLLLEMNSISYQLRSFSIRVRLVMHWPRSCSQARNWLATSSEDSRWALIR